MADVRYGWRLTIGSSDRGWRLRLAKEGIDDLDKAASLVGNATPRRSTSSLDSNMRQQSYWILVLSVALVHGGNAKCISEPKQRAKVIVQSCVAVTFAPSDLTLDFPDNRSGRYYEQGTSYSGSLLSVSVSEDRFVWDIGEEHRTNGFHPWKKHDSLTLFVTLPVNQACPAKFNEMITVDTDRYCCDVLPVGGRCLVPYNIIPVTLVTN